MSERRSNFVGALLLLLAVAAGIQATPTKSTGPAKAPPQSSPSAKQPEKQIPPQVDPDEKKQVTPAWLENTAKAVPIIAALAGAAWFILRKQLAKNVQIACAAVLNKTSAYGVLTVDVSAKNIGKVYVPLENEGTLVRVEYLAPSNRWVHYGSRRVFEDHDGINSDESISQKIVSFVPLPLPAGARVTATVKSGKYWWISKLELTPEKETA